MADAAIPVTVIGGYLGAGKTTLVNRLLAGTTGERVAVLVNDFGSVSIDASLIEAADGDTIRLTNGCVCCSLAGGFVEAMQRIDALAPRPDRLVVETSGVADPAAVAQWAHLPGFVLDAVVVLADAETVRRRADDPLVGGHVRRQLTGADVVVLNKADLVDDTSLDRVTVWVRGLAPAAAVVTAVEADVALDLVLGADVVRRATADVAASHVEHATVTVVGDAAVPRPTLDAAPAEVVRMKGFVDLADGGRVLVQRVGTRLRVVDHAGAPDTAGVALVLIGLDGPAVAAAARTLADALDARVQLSPAPHEEHP